MATKLKISRKAPAKKTKATLKKSALLIRPAKKAARPAKKAARPAKKAARPAKKVARPAKKVARLASKKEAKPAAQSPSRAKKPSSITKHSTKPASKSPFVLTGFLAKQRQRLLVLKDTLLDSMNGVAKDSLRSRADSSESSGFGMHMADAGSDAYDRDFALSLLSQEQDSLYEIDEALKRLESGAYGICEMSGKAIPHPRLEALPFTRYTVECQAEIEKKTRHRRNRQPLSSLFGFGDDEKSENDDDDSSHDS